MSLAIKILKSGKPLSGNLVRAGAAALNKTIRSVKAEASRKARSRYNIKASRIKQGLGVRKAHRTKLQAVLVGKGDRPGLQHYAARWKPGQPVGASVMVIRGQRKRIRGAFMVSEGQHRHVFRRIGASRYPIERLTGPSIPQMLRYAPITKHLKVYADGRLKTILSHEIKWRVESGRL